MIFWNLKNSKFLHKQLTGDSERPEYWENYPCTPLPKHLDDLYIIKMAYHFHELAYTLLFHLYKRDFSEFMLHHIVTLILILFSYNVNYLAFGSVIMLIHDANDIFLYIFKLVVEIKSFKWVVTFYTLLITTWIFFRLYFFPYWALRLMYLDL